MRRDCYMDIKCESCAAQEIRQYAYDDRNYWDNVLPDRKCKKCGKSSKDLGLDPPRISTRYADYEVV